MSHLKAMSPSYKPARSPLFCARCQRKGYSREPIYDCTTCRSYFCESCFQDHRTFPPMRDHNVFQLPKYCQRCQETGVEKYAAAHCNNCGRHYCKRCLDDHDEFPGMNKHYVIPIRDFKGFNPLKY